MDCLRSFAVAGVVGVTTFGSGLFSALTGMPEHAANGQTLMARTPTMLAVPTGYASAPAYNQMPVYYTTPAYSPATAYAPQTSPVPHALPPYPPTGYGPTYPQTAPYHYQPTTAPPAWRYVQSAQDSHQSVLMGRGESIGGPPLAAPQMQLPTPAPSYYESLPMQQQSQPSTPQYQMPYNQMQMQPMPNYAPQGYAMPGYQCGGPTADVWPNGYASMYGQPATSNWFGSIGGLVMTRDRANHYTFSYGTGDEADQRTDTRNAAMGWTGGVAVQFGRYFNCQRNAIEAVYWGLAPTSQTTRTVSGNVLGDLNGILNWNSLDYGGSTADVYVNVAPGDTGVHQLTRDYSFQNLELNLWRFCGGCATGTCDNSRLRSNWLAGVRYFQFNETLLFEADADDEQITYANDEIFYNIDIENHLIGFQVGSVAQYCVCDRLTADLGIKLGVYGNQINHVSEIGGNLGVATINNGPFNGEEFYIRSSKTDIAFLGELNLGLRYAFTCRWTGTLGYRAVAVTGVAMPADQIYADLRGINDVENIDSSRALILHGGYAGLAYNW